MKRNSGESILALRTVFTLSSLKALAVVVVVAFLAFVVRTVAYLNGPPDIDLYAWNWNFQLLMFGIFWLPLIVAFWIVGVVLTWGARRIMDERPF